MYGEKLDKIGDWPGKYGIEQERMSGFIAQEVAEAASELNYEFSGVDVPDSGKDLYSLRYSEFVVPLVKAVQEQQEMIEQQNMVIEQLVREIERLKNQQ